MTSTNIFDKFYSYKNKKLKILGVPLPYDDIETLKVRMNEISPTLTECDVVEPAGFFQESVKLAQVRNPN
jgi:hypothetical protein